MAIGWVLGGIFTLLTIVFVALALLAPEVIGIQGRMAKKIEESHHTKDGDDPKSKS